MTRLQKEISRLLPQTGCTAKYVSQTGYLDIYYEGTELCSLHTDNQIYYQYDNQQSKDRTSKYFEIKDLIGKANEYVRIYEQSPQMKAQGVGEYRRMTAYNNTVLAGMDNGQYGFMFTTWWEASDQSYVTDGDYSPNYDYVKEVFAARSGLIDKNRLFTNNQLKNLYDSLSFMQENNDNLTFDQDQDMKKLKEQIESILPHAAESENQNESFQQNL